MFRDKLAKKLAIFMVLLLFLSACQSGATSGDKREHKGLKVKVQTVDGEVEVHKNPEKVVVLDNRSFETLEDWNIKLEAVPKNVMDKNSTYVKNKEVQNIGDHKEPKLELLAAINPDLVIVGQRFSKYYEEIKRLVPNAEVINIDIDLSENTEHTGENLYNGLKNITEDLGKIFDKDKEANKLNDRLDTAINKAKKSYKDESVMSIIVSGGKIRYAAPGSGRVWGPLYELIDLKASLKIDNSTADHKGDDISVEAIAQSNPDWILVLDRDAAISSEDDAIPAKETIMSSKVLKNTKAIKDNQVIFAPDNTYTNESIQTYINILEDLADAFN